MCTTVCGGFFAFCEYLSRMRRLSPTSRGSPNIILTSLLSSVLLTFPLNIRVFCLHGRALLATGLMFTCVLATTLDVVVCCNTSIRLTSFHYALVAYGVKYIPLLATTLGISVRCNIAIRQEFIRSALMTCG